MTAIAASQSVKILDNQLMGQRVVEFINSHKFEITALPFEVFHGFQYKGAVNQCVYINYVEPDSLEECNKYLALRHQLAVIVEAYLAGAWLGAF